MLTFERQVSHRLLASLIEDLPHRGGKSLDKMVEATQRFRTYVLSLVSSGDFEHVVTLLIDLISDVEAETGYQVVVEQSPQMFGQATLAANGDERYLASVLESLTLLANLLLLALVYNLARSPRWAEAEGAESDDETKWVKVLSNERMHMDADFNIMVFDMMRVRRPHLSPGLAHRLVKTALRILPPKSGLTLNQSMDASISLDEQQRVILHFELTSILAYAGLAAQPDVYNDFVLKAMRHTFDFSDGPPRLSAEFLPAIQSAQLLSPKSAPLVLQNLLRVVRGLSSPLQRKYLLFHFVIPVHRRHFFTLYSEQVTPENFDAKGKEAEESIVIVEHLVQEILSFSNIRDVDAVEEQVVLTCLVTALRPSSRYASDAIWKPFWMLHLDGLHSSVPFLQSHALTYILELGRFLWVVNTTLETVQEFQARTLSEPLRSAFPRVLSLVRQRLNASDRSLLFRRQLTSFIVVFSWLMPDAFDDEMSRFDAELTPGFLQAYYSALLDRVELGDKEMWTSFTSWEVFFVHTLKVCVMRSREPGLTRENYSRSFVSGATLCLRTSNFARLMSPQRKFDLVSTCFANLSVLTPEARGKVMEIMLFFLNSDDYIESNSLKGVYQLLTEFVYEQVPNLVNPAVSRLHWDLDNLHKLLLARVKVASRITDQGQDNTTYDYTQESKLRSSLMLALCDSRRDTVDLAVECLRLLADEMVLVVVPPTVHGMESSVNNDLDYDMLRAILAPEHGRQISPALVFMRLQRYVPTVNAVSRTVRYLVTAVHDFLGYIYENHDSPNAANQLRPQEFKKLVVNLGVLKGITMNMLLLSADTNDREQVRQLVRADFEVLFKLGDFLASTALASWRSPILRQPDDAGMVLSFLFVNVINDFSKREYDPATRHKAAKFLTGCLADAPALIETAAVSARRPLEFDLAQAVEDLLLLCEPYLLSDAHQENITNTFFRLANAVANAENLYPRPKYSSLRKLVDITLALLKRYDWSNYEEDTITLVARAVPSMLRDFTIEIANLETKDEIENVSASFKETTMTLFSIGENLRKSSLEHATDLSNLVHEGMTQFFRSNPELAFMSVHNEGISTKDTINIAILDAFGQGYLSDQLQADSDSSRYDYMSRVLLSNLEIVSAMAEICPVTQVETLSRNLTNLFGRAGQGLALARLAITREVQAALTEQDLFRRNSVLVRIIMQMYTDLGHSFLKDACVPLITQVSRKPLSFLSESADRNALPELATQVLLELAQSLSASEDSGLPPALSVLTRDVWNEILAKFPSAGLCGLRNLLILRVVCPLLVAPVENGLVDGVLNDTHKRALIGIARLLQKLDLDDPGNSSDPNLAASFRDVLLSFRDSRRDLSQDALSSFQGAADADLTNRQLHRYLHGHVAEIDAYLTAIEGEEQSFSDYQSTRSSSFDSRSAMGRSLDLRSESRYESRSETRSETHSEFRGESRDHRTDLRNFEPNDHRLDARSIDGRSLRSEAPSDMLFDDAGGGLPGYPPSASSSRSSSAAWDPVNLAPAGLSTPSLNSSALERHIEGLGTIGSQESSLFPSTLGEHTTRLASSMVVVLVKKLGPAPTFVDSKSDYVPRDESDAPLVATGPVHKDPYRIRLATYQDKPTLLLAGTLVEGKSIDIKLLVHRLFQTFQRAIKKSGGAFSMFIDIAFPLMSASAWFKLVQTLIAATPGRKFVDTATITIYNMPYGYARQLTMLEATHPFLNMRNPTRYLTILDMGEESLRQLKIPDDTIAVVKDMAGATKYEKVPLAVGSPKETFLFDLHVGRDYVVIMGAVNIHEGQALTTDIIPRNSMLISQGLIEFRSTRSSYDARFVLERAFSQDLYKLLWRQKTRPTMQLFEKLPVLHLSSSSASAKLLVMCLTNLCSPNNATLRESAFKLLTALFHVMDGHRYEADRKRHQSDVQIPMVIQLSRECAVKHTELSAAVLKLFVEAINRAEIDEQTVVLVRVMIPWLSSLSVSMASAPNKSHGSLDTILKSLVGLLLTAGEQHDSIASHIWPELMNQKAIIPLAIDTWIRATVENSYKGNVNFGGRSFRTFAAHIPIGGIKMLFERLYSLLDMEVSYSITTWTGHPNWVTIEVIVLILSNIIVTTSRPIANLFVDFSFLILAFSGVGPSYFRAGVHDVFVNLLDNVLGSPSYSQNSYTEVRNLRQILQSMKGKVLFGIQDGAPDMAYNEYSQFSATDVAEVANLVAKMMYAVVPQADFLAARKALADLLLVHAEKIFPALQRKCILSLHGIQRVGLEDEFISRILTLHQHTLTECDDADMLAVYTNAIVLSLSDKVPSLGDNSVYPQRLFWYALSLLSLRSLPIYEDALILLENCIRSLEIRRVNNVASVHHALVKARPDYMKSWWEQHQSMLLTFFRGSNWDTCLVEAFVTGLQDSSRTPVTLAACERIVEVLSRIPDRNLRMNQAFGFALLVYLCSQNLSRLQDMGVVSQTMLGVVDKQFSDELCQELAQAVSFDSDSTMVCLVDACRVAGLTSTMSFSFSGPRLIELICSLPDRRVIRTIAPLLRPTIDRLIMLEDSSVNHKLIKWVPTLFAHDKAEREGLTVLLEQLNSRLRRQGRHTVINSDFQLEPNHTVEQVTPSIAQAIARLCQVIRLPR